MHGGGEYEAQWDAPLRAFRSNKRAVKYKEQLEAEHELTKKFSIIARKAAASIPKMRGLDDLYRWTADANNVVKEALLNNNVPINRLDEFMSGWQRFSDIIFWIDEIEYDTTK